MQEEKEHIEVVEKNPGHRWQAGHPRFGGKRKNTAAAARAMADEMGVDPLEFMLLIINSDVIEQTVIIDGKKKRVEVAIPLDMRLDAAKTVVNYMYPRLTAQQITCSETPVEVVDITPLMRDPAMAKMAQALAISMAKDQAPTPARICGPEPTVPRDPMDTLEKNERGHWK
jgi:hypothetical protein